MPRIARAAAAALAVFATVALAACNSGSVGGATGTPSASFAASPSAPASVVPSASAGASPSGPTASGLDQAFLQFEEQGSSGITGGAILTDLGDGTTAVTIGVVAAGVTDPMPANIVPGTCDNMAPAGSPAASTAPSGSAVSLAPGSVVKLGDLTAGSSNTVVDLTLDALTSSPYAIAIYKSAADDTVVACANIQK